MTEILVIDDDELVGKTIGRVLQRGGYSVSIARNGPEAYALFKERRPRLVVCDLIMPEQNGVEVMRELRMRDPAVKFILTTGGGETFGLDFADSLAPLGFAAIVKKPFEIDELLNAVNAILGAGS